MTILNGFEEDMDTSNFSYLGLPMPILNSKRPTSCTQDSVLRIVIEEDGGTPCTQRYKRKHDNDDVGTSSSKVKRT